MSDNKTAEVTKKAIVVFYTRYGNMEKIARSLEAGLKQSGVATLCTSEAETNLDSLKEYDLIAVGAPTEIMTAPKPIKEFLSKLKQKDFSGKYGFAFDIKLGIPLTGSAANFIEKKLKDLGLEIILEKASAIVISQKNWRKKDEEGNWIHEEDYPFKEGEEKRFEEIGKQLGTALLRATRTLKGYAA